MINKRQSNPTDIGVGSRVRLRRKILGMSQEKLGEAIGVTFQQVQKYENGINRVSASRLQRIAEVLSVPVSFFFEDVPGADEGSALSRRTPPPADYVVDFVSRSEGIRLNTAFVRIKDQKLRRSVIDLVKAIAGEEDSA